DAFVDWLAAAGLVDGKLARRFGGTALDAAAADARRFREWVRSWLARGPGGGQAAELRHLNGLLDKAAVRFEVVAPSGRRELVERMRIESAGGLVGMVALQVARLVTEEDLARVKRCAGPGCTLWFLDRTKAHRRRFCSAAACGNRAKVAAFRARQ